MPAYNFKKQFAAAVEDGTKRQTIRPKRKRPTVPGDTLYLNTGMRTKNCRRLREAVCLSVEPIEIIPPVQPKHKCNIKVGCRTLSTAEAARMARADGFQTIWYFYWFLVECYGEQLHEREFVLIKW